MLLGGESSSLFKHIRELTEEIEEQKRLAAKEEEIGKSKFPYLSSLSVESLVLDMVSLYR